MKPGQISIFARRAALVLGLSIWGAAAVAAAPFMRGADISALPVLEGQGATYAVEGNSRDAIEILQTKGVNWHRLRIFVDPTGSDPFVAQDLAYTISLAQRAKANGARLLLDFHFSDTWADPGHQSKPAAWTGLNFSQLTQQVYSYARGVVESFGAAGVLPESVQIGNEIANGMLWDDGRLWRPGIAESTEFDNLAALLSAGIRGARDGAGTGHEPQVVIHHDKGANWGVSSYYFDRLLPRLQSNGTDIDAIGYSYYPKFHYNPDNGAGGIADLQFNLNRTVATYGKPVVLVETAFASRGAQWEPNYEFNVSPQGQREFLQSVVDAVQAVPGDMGQGVFWWYPEAVPVPGLAVWEGGRYGLFDAGGQLLPAIDVFSAFVPSLDFDGDGSLGCGDIDALVAEIAGAGHTVSFDLTGDGRVDLADRDAWLAGAGRAQLPSGNAYLLGDANLDGNVDTSDFNLWNSSKFLAINAWCQGDFDANGSVDISDLNIWNGNKFRSSEGLLVPEPASGLLVMIGLFGAAGGSRCLVAAGRGRGFSQKLNRPRTRSNSQRYSSHRVGTQK